MMRETRPDFQIPDSDKPNFKQQLVSLALGITLTVCLANVFATVAVAGAVNSAAIDSAIAETRALYSEIDLYEPNSALVLRNPAPREYTRIADSELSGFGRWLRYFPMRNKTEPLTTPAGQFLAIQTVISGVLDLPLTSPRQNSRGALYFLMGLYALQTENELEFSVRSRGDDTLHMEKFVTGTFSLNGNKTKLIWKEGKQKSLDYSTMSRYSDFALQVTTYQSLIRDCQEISAEDVAPGDLYITFDSVSAKWEGHIAIVLDVALADDKKNPAHKNRDNTPAQRLFLFGNSLTPASSFHVIKPLKAGKGAWFGAGELPNKLRGYPAGKFYRLPYMFLHK